MSYQVAIGFGFASDWLTEWWNFSGPITERSKAKPVQSRMTFDIQLKSALYNLPLETSFSHDKSHETYLQVCLTFQ